MSGAMPAVLDKVAKERLRQDQKHGEQFNVPDVICFLFSMEEVGEVAKALLEQFVAAQDGDAAASQRWAANMEDEIIQSAACFVKWAEIIQQRRERREALAELTRQSQGLGLYE